MKSNFPCPACSLPLEWFNGKLWCPSVNCKNMVCAAGAEAQYAENAFYLLHVAMKHPPVKPTEHPNAS